MKETNKRKLADMDMSKIKVRKNPHKGNRPFKKSKSFKKRK